MPTSLAEIRAMTTRIESAAERGSLPSFDDVESLCGALSELANSAEEARSVLSAMYDSLKAAPSGHDVAEYLFLSLSPDGDTDEARAVLRRLMDGLPSA